MSTPSGVCVRNRPSSCFLSNPPSGSSTGRGRGALVHAEPLLLRLLPAGHTLPAGRIAVPADPPSEEPKHEHEGHQGGHENGIEEPEPHQAQ